MYRSISTRSRIAACAGAILLGALPAAAQDAGTIEAGPKGPRALSGPTSPPQSRLPLADFEALDKAARGSTETAPTGKPGVSAEAAADDESPRAFGTANVPYTTARVAVTVLGSSTSALRTPVTSYPYRATGKLLMRKGSSWYVCTGSLIKKSVVVTAAHCVHNFGQGAAGWVDEVRFYPANVTNPFSSTQPYGMFQAASWRIPTPYYNGSDTCTQAGVVCNNDIATVTLNPRSGVYAGNLVGTYSYGWNGYSYVNNATYFTRSVVQLTQLGYPVAFDSGYQMQRTDAVGWYYATGNLKNTQLGSAQTGGSSGGPWLANFGTRPSVSSSASLGSSNVQAVVGTTSYGAIAVGYNRQGASFFGQNKEYTGSNYGGYGAGNIGSLVQGTCAARPWAC